MKLWASLFIVSCAMAQPQAPQIKLEIQPGAISLGQSAVLAWEVTGAEHVYISQLGKVAARGQNAMTPRETTTYVLVAENAAGVASRSVTVAVLGVKGVFEYPEEETFEFRRSYEIAAPSLPDLLAHIGRVLQDTMAFNVRNFREERRYVFLTHLSQKSGLVGKDERRIRARRIAFLVEVPEPEARARTFGYAIKTRIDYRLKLDETWKPEKDEAIYQQQTVKLNEKIRSKP
jgi:hypothetical protein